MDVRPTFLCHFVLNLPGLHAGPGYQVLPGDTTPPGMSLVVGSDNPNLGRVLLVFIIHFRGVFRIPQICSPRVVLLGTLSSVGPEPYSPRQGLAPLRGFVGFL